MQARKTLPISWLYGPCWLQTEVPDDTEMPESCKLEQKKTKVSAALLIMDRQCSIIKCENFSSKERLLRVTAYVLRFIELMKKRPNPSNHLTPEELQHAESYWIKEAQCQLRRNPLFKIWQQQFGLFMDERGVWRCGGRLGNADLPIATKHPVFLDSQHYLTTLIVRDADSAQWYLRDSDRGTR